MKSIAIIDDEEAVLKNICECVKKEIKPQDEAEVFLYTKPQRFVDELQRGKEFDILISDIEMPEMSGMELGRTMQKYPYQTYLVFLTAYSEYAAESYKLDAYQYILKVDMEKRLPAILRQLLEKVKKEKEQYRMIGTPTNKEKVYYRDIIYIEKGKKSKYIQYLTTFGTYKERISLTQVIEELGSAEFIMAGRGYIININHIACILKNMIQMDNGDLVAVPAGNLKKVKEQINMYRGSL